IEEKNGLNVEIVDRNGRSMFPEGSKEPYDRTRRLIERLAAPLKVGAVSHFYHRPYLCEPVAGAIRLRALGAFADRANVIRKMLEANGRADVAVLHGGGQG